MRIVSFVFSLFFISQVMAATPLDLRSFGKEAPVQLYVFTSLSCSHCADFHKNILPELKRKYGDSGKAQIIIVDMIRDRNNMMATQVLRCSDPEKVEKLEGELYAKQSKWAFVEDVVEAKKKIASYATRQGMTPEKFNQCLSDKELQNVIIEQQANLARLYGVTGTPTLVMREGTEVRKWEGADKRIFKELRDAFKK